MRRAAEYLAESPMSVSEIATLLEYSTPSHFARTFRKFYGCPPGQYRTV
ncbi:helix-turn-helix domain-containing protein [Ruegeria sp. HU-ET01832]